MHNLFLLKQGVRCGALLVVVLARFFVRAFTPNVDCTALHRDARLGTTATDGDHGSIVENILDLVGSLLVRSRFGFLNVPESQSLQTAFTPGVEVPCSRHCHAMGDTSYNVNDF